MKRKVCGVRPRRRRSSLVRKGKGTAFELEGAMDWIVLDGFLLFESPPPYFKSVMHTRFLKKPNELYAKPDQGSPHTFDSSPPLTGDLSSLCVLDPPFPTNQKADK